MSRELPGKVAKVTETAQKIRAKAGHHAAQLDRLASHLEALDVWTRSTPGSRRPKLTRDDIAAAAVRIADAESFDAVSMRRLAAELDVGTMSLYHYVHTKDELLTLVSDHVLGEVVVPDGELPGDWREAMVVIGRRSRDSLRRHPWMLEINDEPSLGPNGVRHFDQCVQALASFPGSLSERLDVIIAVDEYVFGHCLHSRNNAHGPRADSAVGGYIKELMASGEYPALDRLVREQGFKTVWQVTQKAFTDESRFERNLRRLLDGFQQRQ